MKSIIEKNINGAGLKYIAMISMSIDHFAAIVIINIFSIYNDEGILIAYRIMRGIGRIAFPIYCFLLVEGMMKTKNKLKYMMSLLVFALISEIPFDLGFRGKMIDFSYQNVIFTLLISGIVLAIIIKAEEKFICQNNYFLASIISGTSIVLGYILLLYMKTDYAEIGLIVVLLIYYYRKSRVLQGLTSSLALVSFQINEWPVFLNMILFAKYNEERGKQNKYVFYIFYPLHILIFYGIAYCWGGI